MREREGSQFHEVETRPRGNGQRANCLESVFVRGVLGLISGKGKQQRNQDICDTRSSG